MIRGGGVTADSRRKQLGVEQKLKSYCISCDTIHELLTKYP